MVPGIGISLEERIGFKGGRGWRVDRSAGLFAVNFSPFAVILCVAGLQACNAKARRA